MRVVGDALVQPDRLLVKGIEAFLFDRLRRIVVGFKSLTKGLAGCTNDLIFFI